MATHRSLRPSLILFSLLLTAILALGSAFLLRNTALRWYYLHQLRSPDAAQRLEAMAYVCRYAPHDPAVRRTMQRWLLDPSNDAQLRSDIIRSLKCADVWGPAFGKAWLHWLEPFTKADLPGVRIGICFEIARAAFAHQPIIADPDTASLLQKLAHDSNSDVRYWAVRAAATLPDASLATVLDIALHDTEPVVVRHAQIIQSLMQHHPPAAPHSLFTSLYADDLTHLAEVYRNAADDPAPATDAKAAYAASRLAPYFGSDSASGAAADVLKPITWTGRAGYQLRELALLENLPPQSIDIVIDNDWPPLVRVAAARAAKNLPQSVLINLFNADESSVRLLACFLAIDRLAKPQLRQVIDRLNHIFYDNERMSGAILIGLTGLEPAVLDQRLQREHVWLVRQHLLLAKWMLGSTEPGFNIDGLLTNTDFPRTTTLLALLHRGRLDGLDLIFQPFRADAGQLRKLLDHQRFWPILNRYLDADHPPFTLWADPATQQFQCDVLRDWYMMRRAHLRFDLKQKKFTSTPTPKRT